MMNSFADDLNDIQFSPRAVSIYKNYFMHETQNILKYFILKHSQDLTENITNICDMVVEWANMRDHEIQTHHGNPEMLENNMDPLLSDPLLTTDGITIFADLFLMVDLEWEKNNTSGQRELFATAMGEVETALLDLLIETRSHTRFIISCDVKDLQDQLFHMMLENL